MPAWNRNGFNESVGCFIILAVLLAMIPAVAVENKELQPQSGAMHPENLERESPLEDRIGSAPDSFLKQFDGELGVKVSSHVVTTAERMVVAMALSHLTCNVTSSENGCTRSTLLMACRTTP